MSRKAPRTPSGRGAYDSEEEEGYGSADQRHTKRRSSTHDTEDAYQSRGRYSYSDDRQQPRTKKAAPPKSGRSGSPPQPVAPPADRIDRFIRIRQEVIDVDPQWDWGNSVLLASPAYMQEMGPEGVDLLNGLSISRVMQRVGKKTRNRGFLFSVGEMVNDTWMGRPLRVCEHLTPFFSKRDRQLFFV